MTAAVQAAEAMAQRAPEIDRAALKQQYREQLLAWDADTARIRRPLYADVEELLNIGFLGHLVRVGGLSMSLRSLSPGDVHLLAHRCGRGGGDLQWKNWAIATSVWMVDGALLLEDPQAPHQMYQIIREFPRGVVDILFSVVLGLFNRSGTALTRTEAYCYEPYSRVQWRMFGRQAPTHSSGIPGAGRLGVNHVQRLWIAHNTAEDDRDTLLREWQAAKLVASAMSPKGIRKINEADDRLHEKEESRRREVAARMVHFVLHGEDEQAASTWKVLVQGQAVDVPVVKTARSAEELEEQFRAWVAGEKDWHDLVVDAYKARIAEQFGKEKDDREALLADMGREVGITGGANLNEGRLVGYTPEQLREFRPDLLVKNPGARRVVDNSAPAAMYQKYLAQEASPGRLRAGEHGVYEVAREEPLSLQEQVERRQPALSTEPIAPGKGGNG